jgi:hypothetical protein
MKIEHAIKLMSRLPIRHRDSGLAVPFKLNPNQVIAAKMMMEQEAKGLPLRVVCLKSRRVGMSSLIDGLGLCHVISQPLSIGRIVAHLDKSVEALFRIPKGLVQGMQQNISSGLFKPPTQEKIIAIHPEGDSELSISTAGSTQGGRGDAFSFLHL